MLNIQFVKTRDVISPQRSSLEEAGIDFFIPIFSQVFFNDLNKCNPLHGRHYTILNRPGSEPEIELLKGGRILIPSGIKVYLPFKTCLQVNNKSGVSSKEGLIYTAQVIDATYYGEVHLGIANISNKSVFLTGGKKLLQMLHLPIYTSEMQEVGTDEYNELVKLRPTERGDNGFGSNYEQLKNKQ